MLDELRRTVLLLRSEGDIADGRPAPGLADIPALVDTMRAAGLDVALTMDAATADDGRGLAAYRVVQEALTNVLRHAHGAAVTVQVTGDPDLHIAVVDTGPARGHALDASELTGGTGHGLVGIAERVEMYGGELMVERGAGEFAVRARIPARVS